MTTRWARSRRRRRAWRPGTGLLLVLMLVLGACAPSTNIQLHRELRAAASATVTARKAAALWLDGRSPVTFTRVTVQDARRTMSSSARSLARLEGHIGGNTARQALVPLEEARTLSAELLGALEAHDRPRVRSLSLRLVEPARELLLLRDAVRDAP